MGSEPDIRAAVDANDGLYVELDSPLPARLSVGGGTALFVAGWCVSARGHIDTLSLEFNGTSQPVPNIRMPRLDVFRALHPKLDVFAAGDVVTDPDSIEDPLMQGYRCGFWGILRVPAGSRSGALSLRAGIAGGAPQEVAIGDLRLAELEPPAAPPGGPRAPSLAIAMATFNPTRELFVRQVESIRAQTHEDWICVVSDDCSKPEAFAEIERELDGDPRFVLSRSSRRLGFYANFERALSMVPPGVRHVAMADQDDSWYPHKLETLLARIGAAELIYSDARIVSSRGDTIAETYWSTRRPNHEDLLSLLVANSVTGAASLFHRELLDLALPFPPAQFAHFHDHWIALVARAAGDIAFCEEPLYDYVQHGQASLGHAAANRMSTLRDRLNAARGDPRERVRKWRMHYFVDIARLLQFAAILDLRCGQRMAPHKRRVLRRFIACDRSLRSLTRLTARGAAEVLGRRTETLGAEWMLSQALIWRRLMTASTRERPTRGLRLDAVPPATLVQQPGRRTIEDAIVRDVADKIRPLEFAVRDDAPTRVNVLIPTIDLEHFFGGYIAKLNLARRLADRGLRVRIVTVDPVGALSPSWRQTLEGYGGLGGAFDRVEVVFGRESAGIEVNRADSYVATTWWTAHIARDAMRAAGAGAERFLYLIQEYEPFTFPHGTFSALAAESYTFAHRALFSSELLRDYFRAHRIGVYAAGAAAGDGASRAFENAITRIAPPTAERLAARDTRRLLFYARPEPHAARNMFELGVLALQRAVSSGAFAAPWELHGIGSIDSARSISLGHGVELELWPRSAQGTYADVIAEHDVGLALMYTPHPSLVPIEMASAGMRTVTNSFENKTQEAMTAISPNLICVPPSIDSVAAALVRAQAEAENFALRADGAAATRWSRNWEDSFDDALLDDVVEFLGVTPRR